MIKTRLKFQKYGPIRFIGHLDVMRYFQKALRRAGVDVAYSEGYSPHQLISFAQPLSVGATSEGEYLDMTLRSFKDLRNKDDNARDLNDVVDRINAVCNEGVTVTKSVVLPGGATGAMTAVAACLWRAKLRDEASYARDETSGLQERLYAFLDQPAIWAKKKTKKGEKEIDLRPLVYRATVDDDGMFTLLLKAGSEDNVKPSLFLGAFFGQPELSPSALSLHRVETYLSIPSETGVCLAPLICDNPAEQIIV